MGRIILLLVVILGAFFAGVYLTRDKPDQGPEPDSISAESERPEPIQRQASDSSEKKMAAMDGIANFVKKKGAIIIDKRVFDSFAACDSSLGRVVAEYSRRGIHSDDTMDVSAFLGSPGKAVALHNQGTILYVACLDFSNAGWAGYLQFSMTEEQLRAIQ